LVLLITRRVARASFVVPDRLLFGLMQLWSSRQICRALCSTYGRVYRLWKV
jgi:hypothetical protein